MASRVYLDWNASAPLRPEARAAMIAAMDVVGNPSSVHAEGRAATAIIERARAQVAEAFGAQAADIVFTSGATEAITACLMAVLNPGDECVLIEPLYDTYLPVVKLLGAVPRLVRLSPPGWDLPREELAAAFGPKTKAILFNSPMNPTGKVFSPDELEVATNSSASIALA